MDGRPASGARLLISGSSGLPRRFLPGQQGVIVSALLFGLFNAAF